jgi:acetylornithine deacetylase/succinyl-diaminopimelate desuccinylase-like protein
VPASSSEVQELLAKLVAFDTTSAKSNLELIAFVKTYLDGYGVASTLIPSADGAKASLFASIGRAAAASASPATATAFRSRAKLGLTIHSNSSSEMASSTAAALVT